MVILVHQELMVLLILGKMVVAVALVEPHHLLQQVHLMLVVMVDLVYRIIMMEITTIGELVVEVVCGKGHRRKIILVVLEV